jgi:hypothetical protein
LEKVFYGINTCYDGWMDSAMWLKEIVE